jgi:hypothetical protein
MNDPLLYAIIGHLVGDFMVQNDWQAANKKTSSIACGIHAFLWTMCVLASSMWWNPIIAAWLFVTHFGIDRTNFVKRWMEFNGQSQFMTGPLSPWSIVVVDNIWHILTIVACDRYLAWS